MYTIPLNKIINAAAISGVPTAPAVSGASAPIFLKPQYKFLTSTFALNLPGSMAALDVFGIDATATYTAQSGTSPTAQLKVQGCFDIADNQTTISATVATGDTSITLTARDGIGANTYVLVVSADGKKAEWMITSSAATTGTGTLNVTRAQNGTTAQAFSSGDYVFFTNSWTDIPSANSTTTTLISGALASISGAAVSTPVVQTVSSHALGLVSIDYPIIRAAINLGGTSPTATVTVNAALKVRSKTDSLR